MSAVDARAGAGSRTTGSPIATRTGLPPAAVDRLTAALGPMLAGLERSRPRMVAATVPMDPVDPIETFAAGRAAGEPAALWHQPGTARSLVGMGAALTIALDGPDRFARADVSWRALLDGALLDGPDRGASPAGPLLMGGGSFADRASADPAWHGFERGRLQVPALLVSSVAGRTTLTGTLVANPDEDPSLAVQALRALAIRLCEWPGTPASTPEPDRPPLRVLSRRPGRAAWDLSVARSAGAVGRGRLDKVVLARRVDLEAASPIEVGAVLRRLEATAPGATIFALTGAGERVFLGATPETLVVSHGREFRTIALAGSIGRGVDAADDERLATALLASEKDREEHAVVVQMLRTTLAPLAERLEIARTPHVVRLRTVQHLASEVSGVLTGDEGILSLVGRLHPTPAVGGWPRDLALELIDEQEGLDRGWYAGPVGWVDADGDGAFVVAIRSGVVDGNRASLFAGCGIVADSEPEREWEESEMKLRALASALGRIEG